jgi:hypothetical protein
MEYTCGHYLETNLNNELWKGPIQYFDNTKQVSAVG